MMASMVNKKHYQLLLVIVLFTILGHFYMKNDIEEEKKDFYLTLGSNNFDFGDGSKYFFTIFSGTYNGFGRAFNWDKKIYENYIYDKSFSGKLFVLWRVIDRKNQWHYFYAALPKLDYISLPEGDFDSYYLYGFLGRLELPGKPEGEGLFGNVDEFTDNYNFESKYVTGQRKNFYYYVVGRKGQELLPVWYEQKNWVEVEGIEITKDQSSSLACSAIYDRSCKPFLSESTPNLTEAQRDYIKRHPVSKDDFSEMIEYYKNLPNNPWK